MTPKPRRFRVQAAEVAITGPASYEVRVSTVAGAPADAVLEMHGEVAQALLDALRTVGLGPEGGLR